MLDYELPIEIGKINIYGRVVAFITTCKEHHNFWPSLNTEKASGLLIMIKFHNQLLVHCDFLALLFFSWAEPWGSNCENGGGQKL